MIYKINLIIGECTIAKPPLKPQKDDGVRINSQIQTSKVRLINADGDMVGVVTISEALRMATESGLDLVEVSPNAEPPVCKILDYGKFKYEQQKKAQEAKKKQKVVEIKEIKLRPGIEEHDYQTKMRKIIEFLEKENKVKITMRFRGREMAHQEFATRVLNRVKTDTEGKAKVEQDAKLEGRQMMMILAPESVKQ